MPERLCAQPVQDADSSAAPGSGHDIGVWRVRADDGFAARAEDGEEGFGRVNPIPEEVGMMFLEVRWAIGYSAPDLANVRLLQLHKGVVIAVRRGREDGDSGLLRELDDLHRVAQRTGERLVDKEPLLRRDHGFGLGEMRPAIDAFEQHAIDFPAKLLDGVDELHAEIFLKLRGVLLDAVGARRDIRAAALESCDNLAAGHVVRAAWVVEQLREGDHVGGVEANDANPNLGGGNGKSHGSERE
jgi:hypothetical protein